MSTWSQLVKATKATASSSSSDETSGRARRFEPVSRSNSAAALRDIGAKDKEKEALKQATASKGDTKRKRPTKHDQWVDVLGRRDKKLSAFMRPSPNVTARSSRHDAGTASERNTSAWASTPSSELDNVREALERKARMYDQLQRGRTAGLSEDRLRESLIDWDRKDVAEQYGKDDGEGHEATERASRRAGAAPDFFGDDDPLVEYEDDLGRTRRVRRSELPREALRAKQRKEEEEYDEALVIHGPATCFPVYEPDPVRRAHARMGDSGDGPGGYKRQAPEHFDALAEKRYRGAGFYQFSQDEQTRMRQMEELRQEREATLRHRAAPHDDPAHHQE